MYVELELADGSNNRWRWVMGGITRKGKNLGDAEGYAESAELAMMAAQTAYEVYRRAAKGLPTPREWQKKIEQSTEASLQATSKAAGSKHEVHQADYSQRLWKPCPHCGGQGFIPQQLALGGYRAGKCGHCGGSGAIE
jgi:hypothetical protein